MFHPVGFTREIRLTFAQQPTNAEQPSSQHCIKPGKLLCTSFVFEVRKHL